MLKIGVTSLTFNSCGENPFRVDELIIFVRRETWTLTVDFNIFAGISPTGVASEPSSFEMSFQISSLVI